MRKLQEIVGGEIVSFRGGQFLLVERTLEELETEKVGKFILENRAKLYDRELARRFPELSSIPKNDMLFVDIETTGLSYNEMIIAASLARMDGSIAVQCAFALDPSQEKSILSYVLSQLERTEAVFTYNGNSFDIPRLNARFQCKGLLNGEMRRLEEDLRTKHHDIYPLLKRRVHHLDYRLQTAEKILFHEFREGDIPGKRIPLVYASYVDGEENEEEVARIIEHNMKDAVSVLGTSVFLWT